MYGFHKIICAIDSVINGGIKMQLEKSKIYADVMDVIDSLDGHEFEYFCAKLLENSEFRDVKVTQRSGDYGVDIIARYHNMIYGIQCKRYASKVGVKAVQEALSGAEYYHCDVAVVLSNGTFTPNAIEMSEKTGVRLWNRNNLLDLVSKCENLDFVKSFQKETSIHNKKITQKEKHKANTISTISKKGNSQNNHSKKRGSTLLILIVCLFSFAIIKMFNKNNTSTVISNDNAQMDSRKNNIVTAELSNTEAFTWSSLYEENHPCFGHDIVASDEWINYYKDQIAINDDKINDNTVMCLNSGYGRYDGKITGITIYYDQIGNCTLGDVIDIFEEYVSFENLQKYYELEDAFTLSDEHFPEDILYYFSEWKIKDEYYDLYDSGNYNGTYQITLTISAQNNAMSIDNNGIPNWAFPENMKKNGYIINTWDIQLLLY